MNDEQRAKALAEFTTYFVENYPGPDTVIYEPRWHAPKIFRAAESALAARNVEEILSRASWQDDGSRREAAYQKASQSVRVEVSKGAFEMGWHARNAEIADLKRQLRQALAQVEIVDRALGDPGNTSSKVALDAYVQEKVGRQEEERGGMALARTYLQAAWAHVFEGLNGDCVCDHHKRLDAYVQEKERAADVKGWQNCLRMVRASVAAYPDNCGDIEIMTAIERIVDRAVLAERNRIRDVIITDQATGAAGAAEAEEYANRIVRP